MRKRPQNLDNPSIIKPKHSHAPDKNIGIVLSGGGSRAAYQVGALKAISHFLENRHHPISVVIGSSIGAINGLVLASCLKDGIDASVHELESLWLERSYRNTFAGSPSLAFMRAMRMAFLQYISPGPKATNRAIFDPTPLMNRVDHAILGHGGLKPEHRSPRLDYVAVMTTVEGPQRKPMLFTSSHKKIEPARLHGASFEVCYVESLSAKHGFASAALPSVLPPVELDTDQGKLKLVDGGISQNIPVDPAVRMGAERVIVVDVSGRDYWLDQQNEAHDSRPTWEVPAGTDTFCFRPPEIFVARCQKPLGPILRDALKSSGRFMKVLGPVLPAFTLLKKKLGEDLAYEVMTYVALDRDYAHGLIERGYEETMKSLKHNAEVQFTVVDPHTHALRA